MKEEIIKLRKKGFTINEIVESINCAKSTVSYHINKAGLGGNSKDFLFGIPDEIIVEIKNLRIENYTYNEISKKIKISEDKLIKICRKLGLNKGVSVNKNKLNNEEVINYYFKVKSIRATAKHFKVSRETIRDIIPNTILINRTKKISKSQAVIDWRRRKKIELVDYKGGKCELCGYNKSISALQFHHNDPNGKDFTISGKSYSIERLKLEVNKCILVCANCHMEIHEKIKIK